MLKEINKKTTINLLNKYFPKEFNGVIISPYNKTIGFYDEKLKGFINYDLIYDRIEINYIYVFDEFRNQGIATKLINNLPDLSITLEVNKNNTSAVNLYIKEDFKIIEEKENYYNNETALIMIKE